MQEGGLRWQPAGAGRRGHSRIGHGHEVLAELLQALELKGRQVTEAWQDAGLHLSTIEWLAGGCRG
jgi:hypothetical protein